VIFFSPTATSSRNGGTAPGRGKGRCALINGGGDRPSSTAARPPAFQILELEQDEDSVGYGGDAERRNGVVQLDSPACTDRGNKAGAVGRLEGIRTPSWSTRRSRSRPIIICWSARRAVTFREQIGLKIEGRSFNTRAFPQIWLRHGRGGLRFPRITSIRSTGRSRLGGCP